MLVDLVKGARSTHGREDGCAKKLLDRQVQEGSGDMPTSPEVEWDDLDRWISRKLRVGGKNARPPEQVWQRIVHHIVSLDGADSHARGGEDRSFGVVMGSTR